MKNVKAEPLSENEKSDMNCVLQAGENVDEKLEKEDIQPCKVCGKDCKTVKQLNDHNLQEHGGTLKCSFCEKMITNDQAAEEEQRIQVMVKKMLNSLCQPTLNITL